MKHSATGFTPKQARKPSNQFKVKLDLTMKGKKNRVYPDLDVGDEVKVFKRSESQTKKKESEIGHRIFTL